MHESNTVEVEERLVLLPEERQRLLTAGQARLQVRKSFVNFGTENPDASIRQKGMWLRGRVNVVQKTGEAARDDLSIGENGAVLVTQLIGVCAALPERRLGIIHAFGIRPEFTLKQNIAVGAQDEIVDEARIADLLGITYDGDLLTSLMPAGYRVDAGFFTDRKEYVCPDGLIMTEDRSECIHWPAAGIATIDRQIMEVERMTVRGKEEAARAEIRVLTTRVLGERATSTQVASTMVSCIAAHGDLPYVASLIEAETIKPQSLVTLYQMGELTPSRFRALLPHLSDTRAAAVLAILS